MLIPTVGPRQYALDARMVFQKNLLDNKLVLASNISWAWNSFDNGIE